MSLYLYHKTAVVSHWLLEKHLTWLVCLVLRSRLLNAFAEEQATEDAVYYLGEALRKDVIDLDVYLKVRTTTSGTRIYCKFLCQHQRYNLVLVSFWCSSSEWCQSVIQWLSLGHKSLPLLLSMDLLSMDLLLPLTKGILSNVASISCQIYKVALLEMDYCT